MHVVQAPLESSLWPVEIKVNNNKNKLIVLFNCFQHYHVENAQVLHFQAEIDGRDSEIAKLKETTAKLEVSLHWHQLQCSIAVTAICLKNESGLVLNLAASA